MLPPPSVGGIELTSGSFSCVASVTVATDMIPEKGSSGNSACPVLPTGRKPLTTPRLPLPIGVNTDTFPYFRGSPVARPSIVVGMTSAAVIPPAAVANDAASAPFPCLLEMTP
jgi:hypothetical protein